MAAMPDLSNAVAPVTGGASASGAGIARTPAPVPSGEKM
jgi:hypothetical protein